MKWERDEEKTFTKKNQVLLLRLRKDWMDSWKKKTNINLIHAMRGRLPAENKWSLVVPLAELN